MAQIQRMRVPWTGDVVTGGGLSTFYFTDTSTPSAMTGAVNSFFTAIRTLFPTGIAWGIPSFGDIINDGDGQLVGTWAGGTASSVASSGGANAYAAGVGCRVTWPTNSIFRGRRVKGSTFLVPLITTTYETNGTIGPTPLSTIGTAAAAFQATPSSIPVVWSRPGPGFAGQSALVVGSSVPDKVSWLRSRRV